MPRRDKNAFDPLFFFAFDRSEQQEPAKKEEFDYPSFMARELTRGLRAFGELDFDGLPHQ